MKIFVCEFITGGGLYREQLPTSLAAEGALMRDALLEDLAALPDIEVSATYDARLAPPKHAKAIPVSRQDDVWEIWNQCIAAADAVWLTAPEREGVLARLTAMAHGQHKILLGCPVEAVRLASSKYATYYALQAAGLNMVTTYTFDAWPQKDIGPWVAKPDDGVGCGDSGYFESSVALIDWMTQGREFTHVIQPYQEGIAASISMLCHRGEAWLLSCNTQKVALHKHAHGSKFVYTGSVLNGMAQYWPHFEETACRIAQVLPDLSGYVGVDIVVGEDREVHVLEINPRLTTSYAGLSRAMGCNAARLVIDVFYNENFRFPSKISRNVVEINLND